MSAEKERGEIVERQEGSLAAVADFVERHWRGAGRPLHHDWIITELQGWARDIDAHADRADKAEAALTTAKQEAFKAGIEAAAKVADRHASPASRCDVGGDDTAAMHLSARSIAEHIRYLDPGYPPATAIRALAQPEQGEAATAPGDSQQPGPQRES